MSFIGYISCIYITNFILSRMVFGKHYTGYSSSIRSGIFNEIAVAALPAFLTMLPVDMVKTQVHWVYA